MIDWLIDWLIIFSLKRIDNCAQNINKIWNFSNLFWQIWFDKIPHLNATRDGTEKRGHRGDNGQSLFRSRPVGAVAGRDQSRADAGKHRGHDAVEHPESPVECHAERRRHQHVSECRVEQAETDGHLTAVPLHFMRFGQGEFVGRHDGRSYIFHVSSRSFLQLKLQFEYLVMWNQKQKWE